MYAWSYCRPLISDGEPALLRCGLQFVDRLSLAAENIASARSIAQSCETFESLIDVSYTNLSKSPLLCWRRLYTDASILRALAVLDAHIALNSIGRLDRAVIISGAAGEGRLDLILSIITKIQREYLPIRSFDTDTVSPSEHHTPPTPLGFFSQEIPRLSSPPSLEKFRAELYCRPFIISGYARTWPAITEHPWASTDYLRAVSGPGRIVPVEVGKDYRTDDWTSTLMPWDEFLSSLDSGTEKPLYLAQHSLFMQFPSLRADIEVPDYVYTCPSPPPDYPEYEPPGNEEQLVLNAWLGPKGTVSPAHTVR